MRSRYSRFALGLSALLLLLPCAVWPQASTAVVSGTVRDQSGAVLTKAEVALTNTATNTASRTTTNEVGFYIFPGVVPGPYRLEATYAGMQKYLGNLTVQVGQSPVVNPVLRPGQTTTTVEVTDVTPMVTVDNPTLGHVLERQRIEQLPINGRNIASLFQTVPGVEGDTAPRAYGMRQGSAEIVLDGASIVERDQGTQESRPPGLDTIQEFKVEVSNSSAKFTRPTTVILSTKSGTNDIHGSAFETTRNNAIGKARMRTDPNTKPPQLIRNEFGASAGGPVVLPGYNGKDRTFWFVSYEGYRSVNPSTRSYSIPTEAMRNGDFSGLLDAQGRLTKIYDPLTTNSQTFARQPFAYGGKINAIDPNRQSPFSKYLNSIIPAPTLPNINPLLDKNWYGNGDARSRQWTFSGRFDHRFSDRDTAYVRLTKADYWNYTDTGLPVSDGGSNNSTITGPNQSAAINWLHTFSPTLFNEVLLSGSYQNNMTGPNTFGNFDAQVGLSNPFASNVFPQVPFTGLGYSYQPTYPIGAANTFYIIDDNATKIHGRHELQFGFHVRKDMVNNLPQQQQTAGSPRPLANFTGLYDPKSSPTNPNVTALTGSQIASLYLGTISDTVSLNRGTFYGRSMEYAGYLQDNWKVTSRLTLNLGMRYEFWPSYHEKNNLVIGFDKDKRAVVLGTDLNSLYNLGASFPSIVDRFTSFGGKIMSWQDAGLPQSLQYSNWKNFGPRLGFAYRTSDSPKAFVIRSGYRISYFAVPLRIWTTWAKSSVPVRGDFAYNPDDSAQAPGGQRNFSTVGTPTYIAGVNTANMIDMNDAHILTRGSSFGSAYANPHNTPARTQDWNFTVEKEIKTDTVARVAYVGNHVDGLEQWYSYNDPTPTYIWYATQGVAPPSGEYSGVATRFYDQQVLGNQKEYLTSGWSNFNAMQFELEKRYSKGYAYQVFYVMGNAFKAGGDSFSNMILETNQYLPGLVPSDMDARNRLLNYMRDSSIPKHSVRWNFIVDLPFGKGKKLAGDAGPVLNRIVGGWQLAGMGALRSNYFSLPTGMFPTGEQVQNYGYQYPVQDCRGGNCIPGYLWWNGYIPANLINSHDASGKPNGIMGVPSNYKPAVQPLNPWPANPSKSDPMYAYYGTNTVWVPMKNGTLQRTDYNPGWWPYTNQLAPSIRTWDLDASLFKTIPIKERFNLRFNADFFNVLNHPGTANNVANTGFLSTRESGQAARQVQLSLRLNW